LLNDDYPANFVPLETIAKTQRFGACQNHGNKKYVQNAKRTLHLIAKRNYENVRLTSSNLAMTWAGLAVAPRRWMTPEITSCSRTFAACLPPVSMVVEINNALDSQGFRGSIPTSVDIIKNIVFPRAFSWQRVQIPKQIIHF
jgi:hypothetical protein